jgi:hypothetical protein
MKSFMTAMAVVLAVTTAACQPREAADDANLAVEANEMTETMPADPNAVDANAVDANAVDANAVTDNEATENITEQGSTDH